MMKHGKLLDILWMGITMTDQTGLYLADIHNYIRWVSKSTQERLDHYIVDLSVEDDYLDAIDEIADEYFFDLGITQWVDMRERDKARCAKDILVKSREFYFAHANTIRQELLRNHIMDIMSMKMIHAQLGE